MHTPISLYVFMHCQSCWILLHSLEKKFGARRQEVTGGLRKFYLKFNVHLD